MAWNATRLVMVGAVVLPLVAAHPLRADPRSPRAIPEEALAAMRDGRFYRASRILADYITTTRDTAPATLLLAARAAAGWGDWTGVDRLLAGKPWLTSADSARGLSLLGWSQLERGEHRTAAETLTRYLTAAGGVAARDRGVAYVRLGDAHRGAGATPDALAAYASAAQLLPSIADWIHYSAARTAAAAGDTAELRRKLDAMDAAIAREWGWQMRTDALREAGDPARAMAVAEAAATSLSSAARRAQAANIAAELHLEAGNEARARTLYRQSIENAPGAAAGIDAARALGEMGGLSAEDRLTIARIYLRHGNYDRGVEGITAWLDARRGTAAERERLRLDLAHAQFRAGRYDDAARTFADLAANASSARLGAETLFFAGRSQYRAGRTSQGRQTFERVADRYSGQDFAARSLFFMADLDQDDGEFERAQQRFRAALASGSDIEEVGFAFMRLAGMAYVEGDHAEAARQYDRYRTSYPTGRRWAQATWWSALAHLVLGHDSIADARFRELRRVDPLSYYGGLAADRLGIGILDMPLRPSPPRSESAAREVEAALERYDLLREIGRNAEAAFELDRIRSRFTGQTATAYAFAEALDERGLGAMAVAIGWDLFSRAGGWNERLLHIIYPFAFRTIVEPEAQRAGVDPFLAAGLIRQESMFQPDAVSGAGAVGLMQVLPATGEALARSVELPRFDDAMLRKPEINVILGVHYLAQQLESYEDRLPLVLGAYNAGPHRITRWSEFPEFADDGLFTERIPFTETREYVKIVQQNARIYRALYGG